MNTHRPLGQSSVHSLSGSVFGDWLLLLVVCLGYSCLFVAHFPYISGIEDEVDFLNQTLIWASGYFTADGAGYEQLPGFIWVSDRLVAWRNPGRPLITLPFVWVAGVPGAYVSGAVIHLMTTLILATVFLRIGCSPLWAVLGLFHPTLALYSRTVMADGTAALFILLAIRSGLGKRAPGVGLGLFLLLATACRYHLAIVTPFVAIALWVNRRGADDCIQQVVCMLLVVSVGFIALMVYNWVTMRNPLGPTFQGYFSLQMIRHNLPRYAASLMFVWPGMLMALCLARGSLARYVYAITWPLLVLLLPYYWMDKGASLLQNLVLGLRLYIPGVIVLLVAYGQFLDRFAKAFGRIGRTLAIIGLAMLTVPIGLMFREHQNHLHTLAAVRDEIRELLPAGAYVLGNSTVRKLFALAESENLQYRWAVFDPMADKLHLSGSPLPNAGPWYVIVLAKPGQPIPPITLISREHSLEQIPTKQPGLAVFRVRERFQ